MRPANNKKNQLSSFLVQINFPQNKLVGDVFPQNKLVGDVFPMANGCSTTFQR
jgi:hypothetical protein